MWPIGFGPDGWRARPLGLGLAEEGASLRARSRRRPVARQARDPGADPRLLSDRRPRRAQAAVRADQGARQPSGRRDRAGALSGRTGAACSHPLDRSFTSPAQDGRQPGVDVGDLRETALTVAPRGDRCAQSAACRRAADDPDARQRELHEHIRLPVHQRIRRRGASRQDLRSDLGHHPRCLPERQSRRPRRRGDAGDHQSHHHRRRGARRRRDHP